MKRNSVKCPRCSKEYDLTLKQIFNGVSCPHCNKKMTMDNKTKKILKYTRYIFVLIVSIAMMFPLTKIMTTFNSMTFIVVIGILAIAFLLAQVADRVCGFILFHTFGFRFVEYVEPQKKEKSKGKK